MWRKRERKKQNREDLPGYLESSAVVGGINEKPELDASNTRHELGEQPRTHEADGVSKHELDAKTQSHEVDGLHLHELEAEPPTPKIDEAKRNEIDGEE